MTRISNETLMAYTDGALAAAQRSDVERALRADPAARRVVLMFRMTALAVKEAFAALPVDTTSAQMLQRFGLRRHPTRTRLLHGTSLLLPLAACLVLAIGIGLDAGNYLMRSTTCVASGVTALGPAPEGSSIARVLDRHDNAQFFLASATDTRLVAVKSLRDKLGNPCLEVDVYLQETGQRAPTEVLVTCKGETGWSVVGAVSTRSVTCTACGSCAQGAEEGHRAMSGVLSMLGAGPKSSTSLGESTKP